jgi:hypothetical protein
MASATIKLFLPRGDAKSLRTAEISNWTGKAVATPRTELDELLAREELDKAGVYILVGSDPSTNAPRAYIGEAEIIRERLKQHKTKEFWVSAIVIVSKDENLTKAHVRYRRLLNPLRSCSPVGCYSAASREPRRAASEPRTASSYFTALPPSWNSAHLPTPILTS